MNDNEQQLVDHLYNTIFVQQLRCNYFNSVGNQSNNSVWNKYSDEKKILDIMVEKYKNYYRIKAEDLKTKLYDMKEFNINSYLTYDKEYYLNEYNKRIDEINKYLVELNEKTIEHIFKDRLSCISDEVNIQFPDYLVDPVLLGKLS